MVSWKGAVAVAAVLVALVAYLFFGQRHASTPATPPFIPCEVTNAVDLLVAGGDGSKVEITRTAAGQQWTLKQPLVAPADQVFAEDMVQNLGAVRVQSTLSSPGQAADYGLDAPRDVVTCRVNSGGSYTLVIGKASFDQGGYYAQRGGDARVYVIGSAPVDQLERRLKDPPIQRGAGPSPSPSPSQ